MHAVYQVATVDSHNVPHVRSQVHRGFLNPKGAPQLPLFITSSDVRAPKVVQMLSNTTVEVCWWMEGSQDQFRILSKALVVPPPDHPLREVQSELAALKVLDEVGEEREDGRDQDGKFDWEKKRREVFEGMKPAMKASWCSPVAPGTPIPSYDEPSKWPREVPNLEDLKTEEDKKNYEFALSNFALVVFEPLNIDWVQLGEHPNRRTLFTRKGAVEDVKWDEEIVAP
jgi:pyridoxamine 5'-phosphate oxidase